MEFVEFVMKVVLRTFVFAKEVHETQVGKKDLMGEVEMNGKVEFVYLLVEIVDSMEFVMKVVLRIFVFAKEVHETQVGKKDLMGEVVGLVHS
jgi:hypothetical protein